MGVDVGLVWMCGCQGGYNEGSSLKVTHTTTPTRDHDRDRDQKYRSRSTLVNVSDDTH
jgi:hypothetical protein